VRKREVRDLREIFLLEGLDLSFLHVLFFV